MAHCEVCNGDHEPDQYQVGYFIEGTALSVQVTKVEGEQNVMNYARENQRVVYWDEDNLRFGISQILVQGSSIETGEPEPTKLEQEKIDNVVAAMEIV